MSDALEQASLIMVPSGYENGTLGSLKPLDGSGDFTFSRGSDISATRVNEDDYIEKGYENLLLQSNSFTTSPWSSVRASVTGGQAGYDGTNDAWLLNSTDVGQTKIQVANSANGVSTISFYAKAGSVNYAVPYITSTTSRAWFNLSTGTIESSYNNIDASIEDAGNGWYRCSMAFNGSATNIWILGCTTNNFLDSEIGDNIYIQDAMLNQGLVAYPYVETTTAPVAGGILEDMPRLDYSNGSCPSLLLEPSRTNLVTYSEYFNSFTLVGSASITPNTSVSPEGYYNAYTLSVPSSGYIIYQKGLYSAVTGESITISIFVKNQINNFLSFGGGTPSGTDVYSIEDYGNGWYRHINTRTFTTTTTGTIQYLIFNQIGTHIIYGAQMEAGSYPTSYIPTYGTSQTRLADVYGGDDISSLVGDNEGTLFVELDENSFLNSEAYRDSVGLFQPTGFERIYISGRSNSIRLTSTISNNIIYSFSASGTLKIAFKYNGGELILFVNGVEAGRETQDLTFNPISFGHTSTSITTEVQENINQILLFPTALSDDECIALTTIS